MKVFWDPLAVQPILNSKSKERRGLNFMLCEDNGKRAELTLSAISFQTAG